MSAIDVIKYDGDGRTLVYRYPNTGFHTAILIVRENQEAILLKNGCICKLYGAGKYTIKTGNIPILHGAISHSVLGGASPNQCEVFFVSKNCTMKIYWGTSAPMLVLDPVFNQPIRIRAHGSLTVQVSNSVKLLQYLAEARINLTREALEEHCRGMVVSRVKEYIANYIADNSLSTTGLSTRLAAISMGVMPKVKEPLSDYGLAMDSFVIESIDILEDRSFEKIREQLAHTPDRSQAVRGGCCKHCGAELVAGSRFCHVCGAAIQEFD